MAWGHDAEKIRDSKFKCSASIEQYDPPLIPCLPFFPRMQLQILKSAFGV